MTVECCLGISVDFFMGLTCSCPIVGSTKFNSLLGMVRSLLCLLYFLMLLNYLDRTKVHAQRTGDFCIPFSLPFTALQQIGNLAKQKP